MTNELVCQWNGCKLKRLVGPFVFGCFHCFQAFKLNQIWTKMFPTMNMEIIRMIILEVHISGTSTLQRCHEDCGCEKGAQKGHGGVSVAASPRKSDRLEKTNRQFNTQSDRQFKNKSQDLCLCFGVCVLHSFYNLFQSCFRAAFF